MRLVIELMMLSSVVSALYGGKQLMRRSQDVWAQTASSKRAHVIYGIRVEKEQTANSASLMEDEGPVLYGIYTSNVSRYQPMLRAQFETWAKDVPRKDIVVSGSKKDDQIEGVTSIPLKCDDLPSGQPCKEGTLLFRAHERAHEQNADWLVSATEDKYIWTDALEEALAALDPTVPVVFATRGCGTRAQSPEYIGCKAVYDHGGICGGNTYIMSRGAIDALVKDGQSYEEFMKEYLANVGIAHASDMVTTCLLDQRGIPITYKQGVTDRTRMLNEVQGRNEQELLDAARHQLGHNTFLTHMVMPAGQEQKVAAVMHAFYNADKHKPWPTRGDKLLALYSGKQQK